MVTIFPRYQPRTGDAQPGQAVLLTVTTDQHRAFFSDWRVGRACVRELRTLHRFGIVTSLTWVLLPDSLRWLTVTHHYPLPYIMQRFKSRSALMVNRVLNRRGPVWHYGFDCVPVQSHNELTTIGKAILDIPIRTGLARTIGDYPLWDALWCEADGPDFLVCSANSNTAR
jgi:hypothetical protein